MKAQKFYELTREQIKHEDQLLNNRTTWLLVLQGFLFSAYSISISAEAIALNHNSFQELEERLNLVRKCIAISGITSSIVIAIGILAASRSIYALVKSWDKNFDQQQKSQYPQIIGKELLGIRGGLIPVLVLPVFVFPFTWAFLSPFLLIRIITGISIIIFFIFLIALDKNS
ncbi:hypothetical protein Lepto7376_0753 [[Leptolyngbya] sp. PCC 7376]|uniref:hypothetical protein n=1 Tax=[Leptolyngbya] sp. PCC 7376 TaxID=111781 RepID=UPI00029F01B9|nr:hypothetical protein [[Leptolyngbya] sp. PCC 7376]AFY37151.1 hypothetical protein Lepto7376_0753 [[Leptolyngbya] sp. PCC 7376]